MSYIQESLSQDEKIVVYANLHWVAWSWFIFWVVISPILLFVPLLIAGVEYLRLKSFDMGATNKRVVFKEGVFSRKTDEIKISSLETISMQQTVMGRMLNYGDLVITGRGNASIVFKKIKDPLMVKKTIESMTPSSSL